MQMAANRSLVLGINRTPRSLPIIRTMARLLHADAIGEPLGLAISNTAMLPRERQTWRLTAPDGGVYFERTLFSLMMLPNGCWTTGSPGQRKRGNEFLSAAAEREQSGR